MTMSRPHYALELDELEAEALTRIASSPAPELAQLKQVLAASSLVDLARPDALDVRQLRNLAQLGDGWDDAHTFAGIALAAIAEARQADDDEAYGLRYLAAARDALRLAELVEADARQARQVAPAAAARRAVRSATLEEFAAAWRALPPGYAARRAALAKKFCRSEKRIEAWHGEARAAGLL